MIYKITPTLQKSTATSYPFPLIISGATNAGVPHIVIIKSLSINLANPKSLILIIEPGSLVSYNKFSGYNLFKIFIIIIKNYY